MHVVNEPYLMGMCEMVMKLRWKPGLSGFHANMPDSCRLKLLTLIFEERKPPASQTGILAMPIQNSQSDFFSNFAVCAMGR